MSQSWPEGLTLCGHRDTQSPGLALLRCRGRVPWTQPPPGVVGGHLNTESQDVAPAGIPAWRGVRVLFVECSNKQGPAELWVQGAIMRPTL